MPLTAMTICGGPFITGSAVFNTAPEIKNQFIWLRLLDEVRTH